MEVDYAPTDAELAEADELEKAKKFAPVEYATDTTQASLTEDVFAPLIPPIALGILAFGLVGLVIWAGQRMTNSGLSHGIGYTRAMDREMATPGPDVIFRPYRGAAVRSQGYATSAAPPPVNSSLITGPFLGQQQRDAAHAALQPIRALIGMVRSYDGKGLWEDPTANMAPGQNASVAGATITLPVNGVPPAPFPGRSAAFGSGPVSNSAATASRAATFQGTGAAPAGDGTANAVYQAEQIQQRAEALASTVDRITPPAQFPEALQPGVKGVSEELHGYLKDADIAATADTQSRSLLRAQAARRLQQAQAYVDYMDSMINGTTDASNMPRPLAGSSNSTQH